MKRESFTETQTVICLFPKGKNGLEF